MLDNATLPDTDSLDSRKSPQNPFSVYKRSTLGNTDWARNISMILNHLTDLPFGQSTKAFDGSRVSSSMWPVSIIT